MKHSYHLDSLRGLLSLVVVMQHSATAFIYSIQGTSSSINTYLGLLAHYSVIFFFVLSGYVITLSISENIRKNDQFKLTEYFISRTTRILPPLIGAIILSYVLSLTLSHYYASEATGNFEHFIRKLYQPDLMVQFKAIFTLTMSGELTGGAHNVNGALWSLVFELQFYVIAGFLSVVLFSRSMALRIVCCTLLVIYASQINLKPTLNIQWISFICFSIGALAYIYRSYISKSKIALPVTLLALALSILMQTGMDNIIYQLRVSISKTGGWSVYMALLGVAFAIVITHLDTFGKFISFFHRISNYSYSLYITHFPVIVFIWFMLVNKYTLLLSHFYILTVVTILICLLFAWSFAKLLERPKEHRAILYKIINIKNQGT